LAKVRDVARLHNEMAQNKTASYLQAAERPCDFADAARVTDGIISQVLTFAWNAPQSHIRGAACRATAFLLSFSSSSRACLGKRSSFT
jgi:hypothetical protein